MAGIPATTATAPGVMIGRSREMGAMKTRPAMLKRLGDAAVSPAAEDDSGDTAGSSSAVPEGEFLQR